jgi:hypothetical protein
MGCGDIDGIDFRGSQQVVETGENSGPASAQSRGKAGGLVGTAPPYGLYMRVVQMSDGIGKCIGDASRPDNCPAKTAPVSACHDFSISQLRESAIDLLRRVSANNYIKRAFPQTISCLQHVQ